MDLVDFGEAEVGVPGQRILPVMPGLAVLADRHAGHGQPVVGAGLLLAVADLRPAGQRRQSLENGIVGMRRPVTIKIDLMV